ENPDDSIIFRSFSRGAWHADRRDAGGCAIWLDLRPAAAAPAGCAAAAGFAARGTPATGRAGFHAAARGAFAARAFQYRIAAVATAGRISIGASTSPSATVRRGAAAATGACGRASTAGRGRIAAGRRDHR